MCGGVAMLLADPQSHVAGELYECLNVLQHRGQDAAGIITCRGERLYQCKGNGLVKDVFHQRNMTSLLGNMGVGHVRYPTAGSSSSAEAQPFYVNSPYGIVLSHNGNLINSKELHHFFRYEAHRHINTDSDSECLLNVFADNLQRTNKASVNVEDVFTAIEGVMEKCHGGFACFAMITGFGIVGFRDPNGIRPICFGSRQSPKGTDYMVCSESVGFDALGFSAIDDIKPGECVVITPSGVQRRLCAKNTQLSPCLFEYVYFARPDSILDGISVYNARLGMGEQLAHIIKEKYSHLKIDVVIPIPDTSRSAALQCAHVLGLPYREGLIKNRYIGRTFIMPGQSQRKMAVRRKLNAMSLEFDNKNVLLVDDSIVRGTTSMEIIMMAREAGAKKVYFASCSPAIRHPNVYGIDMPSFSELVAYSKTDDEVAAAIGADAVIYLELDSLVKACAQLNPNIKRFEWSVFTGEYVTGDVTPDYLQELQQNRNDAALNKKNASTDAEQIGLHNWKNA